MNYIDAKQGAALGARLRRLSERIDGDATRAYAVVDVAFSQRWFGLLNQLGLRGAMTVGELAQALGITHVSVSQSRASLEAAGLIGAQPDERDARRILLSLSPAGRRLTRKLAPLWAAFEQASLSLEAEVPGLLDMLGQLEAALDRQSLHDRIVEAYAAGSAMPAAARRRRP